MIEQRQRVAGEIVEMQIAGRFGGFAEADLIRHHDAVAGLAQHSDQRRQ